MIWTVGRKATKTATCLTTTTKTIIMIWTRIKTTSRTRTNSMETRKMKVTKQK